MSSPTLIIGDGNWAVRSGSLLGYEYGELSGQFAPIPITGSRASIATYTDQSGLIVSASSGVLRVDYSTGTGSLLLEPQRTNSIRNSSMVGAVAGTPGTLPSTSWNSFVGGLTQTIIGTGIENGLPYIDIRFNGTASATGVLIGLEQANFIAASVGQSWTESAYCKVIAAPSNADSFALLVYERNSSAVYIGEGSTIIVPTSDLQRFTFSRTIAGATAAFVQPYIRANLTNGATYDFTIRIAAPQMELGAYVTTWIPTTNTTATRIVDIFYRPNIYTDGNITSGGGTWFVELNNNIKYTRDNTQRFGIADTTGFNNDGITIGSPSASERVQIQKRIASVLTTLYTTTTDICKIAVKWNGTTADVFENGVKVISATAFTPTVMEYLGSTGACVPIFITQSKLYNQPLSDAECTSLTTL